MRGVADADVVVIGAGAAGLAAAPELRAVRRRFIVLEARDHVGGRVLTVRDPRVPVIAMMVSGVALVPYLTVAVRKRRSGT